MAGWAAGGNATHISVWEESLGKRGERDAADPFLLQHLQQLLLDPAIEHRVRRLVDQPRRPQSAENRDCLARPLSRVGRDSDVQRLALSNRGVERSHRLFKWSLRVEAVG